MHKTAYWLLTIVATVLLSLLAVSRYHALTDEVRGWEPAALETPSRSRAELEAACALHVTEAHLQATEVIAKRAAIFWSYVHSRKRGVRGFSRKVVSMYGKWRVVKPHLPFTNSNGHREFVIYEFNRHIFTARDLGRAVQRAIEDTLKDLEAIENDLAVTLRQEILGRSLAPDEAPVAAEEFRLAVERMVAASQWDATKSAGSLVVSEVAAQVATQVLVRLGISAGILTAGAANTWWSFGGALVIGVMVDLVWEWVDDPAGDIEREMTDALDGLARKGSTAIKAELLEILEARCAFWRETIHENLP